MDLVRKHVSKWVCMGGNFPVDPAKDNVNFTRDPEPALIQKMDRDAMGKFMGEWMIKPSCGDKKQ